MLSEKLPTCKHNGPPGPLNQWRLRQQQDAPVDVEGFGLVMLLNKARERQGIITTAEARRERSRLAAEPPRLSKFPEVKHA